MKLQKRNKLFFLFPLFLIILLLSFLIIKAGSNQEVLDGFKSDKLGGKNYVPVFWNTTDNENDVVPAQVGTCIINNSDKDFFVPTRTLQEWTAFVTAISNPFHPSGLKLKGCDGDGECRVSAGENCTNAPLDCGSCGSSCAGLIVYEGQAYRLVQIGSQCWLDRNLNIGARNITQTNNGIIEKYCEGDSAYICGDTTDIYQKGGLYHQGEAMWGQSFKEGMSETWSSASPSWFSPSEHHQGICPSGWHIPSVGEFRVLADFLYNTNDSNPIEDLANKLKQVGEGVLEKPFDTFHQIATNWLPPFSGGTNFSGFSAVPSVFINDPFVAYNLGKVARFWTTSFNEVYELKNDFYSASPSSGDQTASVRCIRDEGGERFYVTVFAEDGGNVSLIGDILDNSVTQIIYGLGKNSQPVEAHAKPNCEFRSWSDGVITPIRTFFNINSHINVTARFNCYLN